MRHNCIRKGKVSEYAMDMEFRNQSHQLKLSTLVLPKQSLLANISYFIISQAFNSHQPSISLTPATLDTTHTTLSTISADFPSPQ